MAETTSIQWADATVNFAQGCLKVSAGCKYCYMYRDFARYGRNPMQVVRSAPATFNKALTWSEPKRIFTNSWSDFFIKEMDEFRDEAWDIIRKTPHHTWMILTKRPERIKACLPPDWGKGWDNVWLGVSVENKKRLHIIDDLIQVPCKVRFLSMEPLLENVDIKPYLQIKDPEISRVYHPIHWVIVGGESGNDNGEFKYRPCDAKWLNNIVIACQNTNIPVFVKQLGTHLAKQYELKDRHGGDMEEEKFPIYLRVREFPKTK